MRPRRTEKIDIRVNPKFKELLKRMKRISGRYSNADILCLALSRFAIMEERYQHDQTIFELAVQIQDINNKHG